MTNLKPLAILSLPILGTLMILNFGIMKPLAKNKLIIKHHHTEHILLVRK